jgi:hypothetical protein
MGIGSLLLGGCVGEAFGDADAGWLIGGGLFLVLLSVIAEDL